MVSHALIFSKNLCPDQISSRHFLLCGLVNPSAHKNINITPFNVASQSLQVRYLISGAQVVIELGCFIAVSLTNLLVWTMDPPASYLTVSLLKSLQVTICSRCAACRALYSCRVSDNDIDVPP